MENPSHGRANVSSSPEAVIDSPASIDPGRVSVERPSTRVAFSSRSLEGADPAVFLRLVRGRSRGFWARGDRWIAHGGEAVRVSVPAWPSAHARFASVLERARDMLGSGSRSADGRNGDDEDHLRFFGGFSFREDHHASGFWEAFPPALFVLPQVELEGAPGGRARLRARTRVDEGESVRDAECALEERLDELSAALAGAAPAEPAQGTSGERTEMARVTWEDAVEEALRAIEAGRVSKVVLARTLDVTTEDPVDPVRVVGHLWRQHRGTHTFLFEPRPGRALLGAAPETIATLRRGRFHATAVAGSIARGSSDGEQARLARRLLESAKDREEHAIALRDMLERLEPLATNVAARDEPHVLTLARIQHLQTEIAAEVSDSTVLDLLDALHPTPSVCGLPRDEALEFLRAEEPFERGWYAGPVGFFDAQGEGVFAPALRMGVAHGRTWRLYAGAGIVRGSRSDLEWDETAIKFQPVLSALAASGALL